MNKKISVLLYTSDYRGDHSADMVIAYDLKDGETVEELAERLIKKNNLGGYTDHIEVRWIND